jgi:hypothetical protein
MDNEQEEIETGGNDAQLLASFLPARDVLCPKCGYSLRGLQTDTCPECSNTLRLVLQEAPVHAAWHTLGVIGLSSGIGFGWVVAADFAILYSTGSGLSLTGLSLFLSYATVLICGVLLWLWCRNRSRIAFMPRTTRIIMVAACFVVSAICGGAFAFTIQ